MTTGQRLVLTLAPGPADFARDLAEHLDVKVPEAVRRGLTVLHLTAHLGPDEELVIRNRKTKETERVVFQWHST